MNGTDYWTHYLRPQNGNLQLYTANGGKGLTWEINRASGYVAFVGGHGDVSDQSLKTAAQDANVDQCLRMLKDVSARTYERLDQPGKSRLGFIAQEVRDAAPHAFRGLIGTAHYSIDRDGADERGILTLDYGRLSAVLWQATRSLLARVEALEARLAQ